MRKIRIIIADDEPLARGYLRSLLAAEPDCEIVAECGDAESAIAAITRQQPDLVLLDVQMPGSDGFSVIERIGSAAMPHTIFVTAHDRYAIPAFDKHALDYLLKPFSEERFSAALDRARVQLSLRRDAEWSRKLRHVLGTVMGKPADDGDHVPGILATAEALRRNRPGLERIPVKTGGRVILLSATEIVWIEAADCYVNLHSGGKAFLLRESLNALQEALDPRTFVRIHRGSMVNINCVKEIRTERGGASKVILKDGTQLALSRRRKRDVENLLGRSF